MCGLITSGVAHVGHSSKSQRSYNVRFRSDIRGPRRARKANSAAVRLPATEQSHSTADHTTTLTFDHSPAESREQSRQFYDVSPGTSPQGNEHSVRDHTNVDDENGFGNSETRRVSLQRQIAEGAALLYSMSVDSRRGQSPPLCSATTSPSHKRQNSNAIQRIPLDESSDGHSTVYLRSPTNGHIRSSSFGEARLSRLTFQDDILPNIPRAVTPLSTWNETPSSDRRFYLQYCKRSLSSVNILLRKLDMEVVMPRLMPLWTTPDNPCLCIVIPASYESPIVMHAVMALSAYHHSLESSSAISPGASPNHSRNNNSFKALWHKQKVLLLLQETLGKPDVLRDDATLAACMLMQTFEVGNSLYPFERS